MFRSITILAACLAAASGAQASPEDTCRSWSGLAKTIMTGRQGGMAMADMMDSAVKGDDPAFSATSKELVISAFEHPRFSTPAMQSKATTDFQNDIYLQCIKSAK